MPKVTLTDIYVKNAPAPDPKPDGKPVQVEHWDQLVDRFALRVSSGGARSWIIMYRLHGKLARYTISRYPAVPLGKARADAKNALQLVDEGKDPKLARDVERQGQRDDSLNTFGAVAKEFIEHYGKPKLRGWKEVERYFDRDLAAWRDRPMSSITRADVNAAIRAKAKDGPYAANRLLAYTRKLFSWAVGQDIIPATPVSKIDAQAEQERDRVLSDDEIKMLWAAWGDYVPPPAVDIGTARKRTPRQPNATLGWPFGPMFRLLLLTAQRRDEVAGMRWQHIDFEKKIWTIPGSVTKSGRSHEVPLSPLAIQILERLPRMKSGSKQSPYVFPSRRSIERYASGFSKAMLRCGELAQVEDWRLHDLRRTAGTGMAALGVAVSTISRIMNHAEGGVTKIYNRYSYGSEKRAALEKWADKVAAIVG